MKRSIAVKQVHLLYIDLKTRLETAEKELVRIRQELDRLGKEKRSIVIKKIAGNPYYYEQWREDGKIRWKSLGKVVPGGIAEKEKEILHRNALLEKEEEQKALVGYLQGEVERLNRYRKPESVISDYSFEVYWKNVLTAKVSVRKDRVQVKRLVFHPIRQLFSADRISRNHLNEVLRLRCFEENRADAAEKLRALGLSHYNPLEIVRKTHGVSYNDYIWIRFPGEKLTAKEVLVRDEYV